MQNEEGSTALLPDDIDDVQAADALPLPAFEPDKSAAFVRRAPSHEEGEEIARLGREWYERKIRVQVEPQHNGKFLSIDVDTGEYALGEKIHATTRQFIDKNPAVRLYGLRVGVGYLGRV